MPVHIAATSRPVPANYHPEIIYLVNKVIGHPPGMSRFTFQTHRGEGMLLTRKMKRWWSVLAGG
jgi:hypothetical protein